MLKNFHITPALPPFNSPLLFTSSRWHLRQIVFGGNRGFSIYILGRHYKIDHALEHFIVALETAIIVETEDVV